MRVLYALPLCALLVPAFAVATRGVPAEPALEPAVDKPPAADEVVLAPGVTEVAPLTFRVPAPIDPATLPGAPFDAADDLATRLSKTLAARPELRSAERRLAVDKSRFVMEALAGDQVLRRYVVNLGFEPFADKEKQGDGRTPEGRRYIRDKHDSAYTRFFGLSYPNARDAERGLAAGLIDDAAAARLRDDQRRGRMPASTTPLGGAVGIHGGGGYLDEGATVLLKSWTYGCIGMRSSDVRELDAFVVNGTPVDITR